MSLRAFSLLVAVIGLAVLLGSLLGDLIGGSSSSGFGTHQVFGACTGALLMLSGILLSPAVRKVLGIPLTWCLIGLVGVGFLLNTGWLLASLERGATFEHDRTIGPRKIWQVLSRAQGLGIGVCRCSPDAVASLSLPGGFKTPISIYGDDDGTKSRPGILLVHGNTWLGQQLATYRLLAHLLARRGYIVATFDKPGFGQSEDPFGRGRSAVSSAFDRVGQVNAAVEYLIENTPVDDRGIVVFGHSAGVAQALRVGAGNPSISAVIVMVAPPPPPSGDDYQGQRAAYFNRRFDEQYEFIYGKKVPEWVTWDLTAADPRYREDAWTPYKSPGHSPVMIVLGENDEPAGHSAVAAVFTQLVEPKKLTLIKGSDHYANTAQSSGLVFYQRAVARQLVDEIVTWLQDLSLA